ncbi:MAG: septum site-determining protein MinD [Clostridiales bacterium]|nr:septum site-determining protein MinD [Clostridiales bacterium]
MAEKIFVSSYKGGVGVTTFCIGVAIALATSGEKTLIVDGDFKCASALTVIGCTNLQVFSLKDYADGACRAKQILIAHPAQKNLYIMPTLNCDDEECLKRAILEVEGLFDFILLDKCASKICSRAIVVTEPYLASLKCADACIASVCDGGISEVGIVVNKVNGGFIFDGEIMPPEEISYLLHAPLKAVIPEDLLLPLGKCKGETLKAFKLAAQHLCGKTDKIFSVIKGYYGVKGAIKRRIRKNL